MDSPEGTEVWDEIEMRVFREEFEGGEFIGWDPFGIATLLALLNAVVLGSMCASKTVLLGAGTYAAVETVTREVKGTESKVASTEDVGSKAIISVLDIDGIIPSCVDG
jgi:hypothetical protein